MGDERNYADVVTKARTADLTGFSHKVYIKIFKCH